MTDIPSLATDFGGTPAPAPAPADGGGAPAPAPAPAPDISWAGGDLPDDVREWLTNKAYDNPTKAIEAHRSLEKLLGGEKVPWPKGPDDTAAYDNIFERLGRPKTPTDYDFGVTDDTALQTLEPFRDLLHKHGVSATAAKEIGAKVSELVAAGTAAEQEAAAKAEAQAADAYAKTATEAAAKLKAEWGQNFEANINAARAAALRFLPVPGEAEPGETPEAFAERQKQMRAETIGKIEKAIGYEAAVKLWSEIGLAMGETGAPGLGGSGAAGDPSTEEALTAEHQRLLADKEFMTSYAKGDKAARERMQNVIAKLGAIRDRKNAA